MIKPTQADRDFVASKREQNLVAANGRMGWIAEHIERLRNGGLDHDPDVQAAAHHAEQARLEERDRCAGIAEALTTQRPSDEFTDRHNVTIATNDFGQAIAHGIATTIRKGETA